MTAHGEEERPISADIRVALEHARIAVQLDGNPESSKLPPQDEVPWHGDDCGCA